MGYLFIVTPEIATTPVWVMWLADKSRLPSQSVCRTWCFAAELQFLVKTSRPRPNSYHSKDDILKFIFFVWNFFIMGQFSFGPNSSFSSKPSLVQIKVWQWAGVKANWSNNGLIHFNIYTYVTWWVKSELLHGLYILIFGLASVVKIHLPSQKQCQIR